MTSMISGRSVARYAFGPFILDVGERRLQREGKKVALPRKAFDLLFALVERAGHLQTREALIEQLWPNTIVEEHSLTWNLHVLRRTIGDLGDAPQFIETVRGIGYRFIADVSSEGETVGCPWDLAEGSVTNTMVSELAIHVRNGSEAMSPEPGHDADIRVDHPDANRRAPTAAHSGYGHKTLWLGLGAAVVVGLTTFAWRLMRTEVATAADAVLRQRSIAVLPLQNLDSDPADAYFASGLQDAIASKLATIQDLHVFSRESVARVAGQSTPPQEIARKLGVSNLLAGSIQHAGDDLVVSVRLLDGANAETLWDRRYTRKIRDVLDVQSDVAERVAYALRANVLPDEISKVERLPTRNAQAYDLFLRAEYEARGIEFGDSKAPVAATRHARTLYEQAIENDPNFALALSRLSVLDSRAYWFDVEHTPARAAAGQRAAQRALEIDPDLPAAHIAMGYAHYFGYRNYDAAVDEFQQALRMLPGSPDIMAYIAYVERRRGHWDVALEGLKNASALDPRNPALATEIANTLMMLRQYEDAKTWCGRARIIDQENVEAVLCTAHVLLMEGDPHAASEALRGIAAADDPEGLRVPLEYVAALNSSAIDAALQALKGAPRDIGDVWMPSFVPTDLLRAQALELKNDREGAQHAYTSARDQLAERLRVQPDDPNRLSLLGLTLAGLGQKSAALAAGERAVALRPSSVDALDGVFNEAALAEIYVRIGKADEAIPLLRRLTSNPAGLAISDKLIANDPRFADVRDRVVAGTAP